jgi:hypothetical protein
MGGNVVRRAGRHALVVSLALGVGACANVLGLGDYVDAPPDAGGAPGTVADGSPGGGEGGDAACAPVGTPACFQVPTDWTLVAFADSAQTTCPAGFSKNQTDLFGGAIQPASDACACDACTVATQPSCVQGPIAFTYDSDGSKKCNMTYQVLANANAGGCNTDGFHGPIPANQDVHWVPPSPKGGTCTASSPTTHPDRVTFAENARACSPDDDAAAGCVGGACSPALAAPFAACLAHAGNVACPSGPFGVAHHVGTGATFDCGGTCGCTVSASCTNRALTFYTDGACQSATPLVQPVNDTCVNQGTNGGSYGSYKYSATVVASCSPTGTATASNTALAGEETVCCAQ